MLERLAIEQDASDRLDKKIKDDHVVAVDRQRMNNFARIDHLREMIKDAGEFMYSQINSYTASSCKYLRRQDEQDFQGEMKELAVTISNGIRSMMNRESYVRQSFKDVKIDGDQNEKSTENQ